MLAYFEGDSVTDWTQSVVLILGFLATNLWTFKQMRAATADQQTARQERLQERLSVRYAQWAAAAYDFILKSSNLAATPNGTPMWIERYDATNSCRFRLREAQFLIHLEEERDRAMLVMDASNKVENATGEPADMIRTAMTHVEAVVNARRKANFPRE